MIYQRIARYLTARGYVRALYNFEPSFVKPKAGKTIMDVPMHSPMDGDPAVESDPVEHVVSAVALMDWVVMEAWDSIASALQLDLVQTFSLMADDA